MPYTNLIGKNLSKSRLQKAVRMFRPSEAEFITELYWEDVPDDKEYTMEQKLEFILCTMRNPGMYSAEALYRIMAGNAAVRNQICGANPRDYPGAHIVMCHRAQALCPDAFRNAVDAMRPHKHVPEHILSNDLFVGCVCMTQFIDHLTGKYRDRENPVEQVDEAVRDDAVFAAEFAAYAGMLHQNHMRLQNAGSNVRWY